MPSPSILINSGLALVLAAGIGGAYLLVTNDGTAEASSGAAVTTATQLGTVTRTVAADGTVEAVSTVTAEFAVASTVTGIQVAVGDVVEKGQKLATVDASDAERELELAESNLEAAEDSLDRAETDTETDTAEDAVDDAEAAVEEAEDTLADTVLTAPAAGTVIAVNGTVGETTSGSTGQTPDATGATESSGFIQIADLSRLQVAAAVAEGDADAVVVGQAATVTWNAIDATADAELTAIAPTAAAEGDVATYEATLTIAALPEQVRIGQTVTVSVIVEEVAEVLYLPAAAVEVQGDQGTVTVVGKDGAESEATVQIGLQGDQTIEIVSGLAEGDTVALNIEDSLPTGGGFEIPEGGFPGGGFPGGGGGFPAGSGFPGGGS